MKTKRLFLLLFFTVFAPWAATAQLPCLPQSHGLSDHQSAWCGDIQTIMQSLAFAEGSNWFSTYVDITLEDLQTALTDVLSTNVSITIQSQTQSCSLKRGSWTGQLTSLDLAKMYKILVPSDCEISLEGMPVDPSEHPVTISNGDNWIAYPFAEGMTLSDAFMEFAADNDIVNGQTCGSKYTRGRWNGQLNTLEPGKGYIYNSSVQEDRTFTFPMSAK